LALTQQLKIPQSPNAEASVIGAAFIRPSILSWLALDARDFFDTRNQQIWSAMLEVYEYHSANMDAVLVEAELDRRKQLAAVGGVARLADMAQLVPTADNVEHYAAEIVRKRIARDALVVASRARQLVEDGIDGEELLTELQRDISRIDGRRAATAVSIYDACRQELKDIGTDMASGRRPGVPTGIRILDERIGGIPFGVLSILAARPSVGKSAIGLTVAESAALAGVPTVYFTYEDSIPGFAQRALARHGGVAASKIRGRELAADDVSQLMRGLDAIRDRRGAMFVRAHGMTVEQLIRAAMVERRHASADRFLVVVDYVNLGPPSDRGMRKQDRVAHVAEKLSEFAGRDGVAVLALAQLNRESEKEDRPPRLSDLRDAGELEQIGKLVLALQDELKGDELTIHCLKNHQGPRGEFVVNFDRAHCRVW
jgi:replicative DNA helicase